MIRLDKKIEFLYDKVKFQLLSVAFFQDQTHWLSKVCSKVLMTKLKHPVSEAACFASCFKT